VFSSEEWARVEAAAGCLDAEGLFGLRGAGLVRALVMVGCGEVERRSPALFERASEEAGGGTERQGGLGGRRAPQGEQ